MKFPNPLRYAVTATFVIILSLSANKTFACAIEMEFTGVSKFVANSIAANVTITTFEEGTQEQPDHLIIRFF